MSSFARPPDRPAARFRLHRRAASILSLVFLLAVGAGAVLFHGRLRPERRIDILRASAQEHLKQGEPRAAEIQFENVLKLAPNDVASIRALIRLRLERLRGGEDPSSPATLRAVAAGFRRLWELDSSDPETARFLLEFDLRTGDWKDAHIIARTLTRLAPRDPLARAARELLELRSRVLWYGASFDLGPVLATAPDLCSPVLLALAQESAGRAVPAASVVFYRRAVDRYRAALRLDPRDQRSANQAAWLLGVKLGRPAEGLAISSQAIAQVSTPRPELLDTHGMLLLEVGRAAEAAHFLDLAHRALPYDESIAGRRAVALLRAGRVEEGLGAVREHFVRRRPGEESAWVWLSSDDTLASLRDRR